jgi:AcrR family transcriptional regulator
LGRPRAHDAGTAARLLVGAERIVRAEGLDALTVRRVADEVGTTTRAVYSLFGSKDGLVVALGQRAFELLGDGLAALPETDDPAADLVEAGITVLRRFAIEHPSLFRIAVQLPPSPEIRAGFSAVAWEALARLRARVARLEAAGQLGARPVWAAVLQFHALCEGLAAVELRGQLRLDPPGIALPADRLAVDEAGGVEREGIEERMWRDALTALVRGFALSAAADRVARGTAGERAT